MAENEARIPVYLNDEQAKAALKTLTKEAEKWRNAMRDAMVGGDLKGMKDAERELKKVTNETAKLKREAFDTTKVLQNLAGASLSDLRKTEQALRRQMDGINRNTKEWKDYQQQLQKVVAEKRKVSGEISGLTSSGGPMQKLIGLAKGLLPAFSFAAIGAAAVAAFNKITQATDTLSTQWAIFMGGMKGATDAFFRSIATGDWSNLIDNMRTAITVGREYERVLDEIEAKQRAQTIAEADALEEITRLEEDLRNKGLSPEQNLAAGKRRIQIEEELAQGRTKIAKQTYENDLSLAENSTKLSKENLMRLIRDMDSEKKIRAEKLLEMQRELRKLEADQSSKGAGSGVLFPGMQSQSGNAAKINELKAQIAGFSPVVTDYAQALAMLGNSTDAELNKLVQAYSSMKQAEVSGRDSIKRVITMVNSLQAGEEKAGATATAATTPPEIGRAHV